ncbi:hypothetical protein B5P46_11890 [Rhizobium leguminosarum]|uniref:SGNH/GDSL hydrolase family protein n=1 Tax=Rhizobium leguminosarum TaxID=384 RepID=A0A4Q1UEB5_RHILE|nr:hypothetical protein [Rhizobium leguminosarum]RXT29375.1 hypothetical protein B5P46_11890 [Rhizobium leguminosarum]
MLKRRTIRVECIGDSFERGYTFGRFSDQVSVNDRLWQIASPSLAANLLMSTNNLPVRFRGGNQGFPISRLTDAGLPAALAAYCATWNMDARDWMLLEDAGDHIGNPDTYQAAVEAVIDAVAPVRCAVITAFDYPVGIGADPNYQWDRIIPGFGRSMNAAKIAAAASRGALLIDENAAMDAYRSTTLATDLLDPMQHIDGTIDGIHAGPWGTLKEVSVRLTALGLAGSVRSIEALTSIANVDFTRLQCGATVWNGTRAISYCSALFPAAEVP